MRCCINRWIGAALCSPSNCRIHKCGEYLHRFRILNNPNLTFIDCSKRCFSQSKTIRISSNQTIYYTNKSMANNTVEAFGCNVNDMKDGEMREVEIGESKALLVKDNGQYSAIGYKCTHYGAQLKNGSLKNGIVRCPWHGACFNIKTGDIEDYPGLDCVPKHEVFQANNKVMIRAKVSDLSDFKRRKPMDYTFNKNGPQYLIIGGGPTSVTCAETLRQKGFSGKISVVSSDSFIPYDRPKLSKVLSLEPEKILLRSQKFYDEANIEFLLGKQVNHVNVKERFVSLSDGQKIKYDKLLLATGGVPRTLSIPGWTLKNVCVLRSMNDASFISQHCVDKNVVMIGASFIGMELASALVSKSKSVTVCDIFAVPFEPILGKEVGLFLQHLHESKGVKFCLGSSINELKGSNGVVTGAVLKNGQKLKADVVIAGVGVKPATDFLKGSGISMSKHGFVNVDRHMRVLQAEGQKALADIYAGGDIAFFPLKIRDWEQANVQHWQTAHYHGSVVGHNMMATQGKEKPADSVPFFWTQQYGKSLRYTGYGFGFDDVITTGDVSGGKFCAYYTKGDKVVAVATMMSDPVAAEVAQRLQAGEVIRKSELK